MSRGLRYLTVVLLSFSLGCHWTLVQGVAWVTMFAGHVRSESVPVALTKTFDGQHPCRICQVVRAGRSAEEKSPGQSAIKKLEPVPLNRRSRVLFAIAKPLLVFQTDVEWLGRNEVPPVPPPKLAV